MVTRFLICVLLLSGCRKDIRTFEDGEFITEKPDYAQYTNRLKSFLTRMDSIERGDFPILPPNLSIDPVYIDTIEGIRQILINTSQDHDPVFRDVVDRYEFRAYDASSNIAYIREVSSSGWSVKGILLEEGNQFELCRGGLSSQNYVYDWEFSPSRKYLLKVGDLDNESHGWSLVNLETGAEGKMTYKKHYEILVEPKWVSEEEFTFSVVEMPFINGYRVEDYSDYRSILREDFLDFYKLKYNFLFIRKYRMHVKGYMISESFSKVDI